MSKTLLAMSLFAGAGGCSLGFKKAGYDILYALELNLTAIQTYQTNFTQTICLQADLRDFDFRKWLKQWALAPSEILKTIVYP